MSGVTMDVSVFRTVAVGTVAENKSLLSKEIAWYSQEWSSMRDGEIASRPEQMTFTTQDINGTQVQGGIVHDNTLKATWLPSGSNRLTAPNVRRGERVEILQVGDTDKFYWRTMGLDDNLRKLETIIFGISDTQNEDDGELNPANMYWFEFSTHSKKLAFSSSKADGEPYLYEMYFDFLNGEFQLTDDIGNFVNLVSKLSLIHLQNDKGTFVKLDKKDINMYAPQDVMAKAVRNIKISAGKELLMDAGVLASITVGGTKMTWTPAVTTLKTPKFQGST